MTNLCGYGKVCSVDLLTYRLFHLIQAEWRAAQMDERAIAGLEDEDEEGVSLNRNMPPHREFPAQPMFSFS